jgi:leucine-rich PPR motif-containing protein
VFLVLVFILETITSSQGLYLIRCCGNLLPEELLEERNNLVQKIWELLLNFEVPLDINHFNSLLRIYLENEHSFNPLRFLSTMIEREIQPDRVYS